MIREILLIFEGMFKASFPFFSFEIESERAKDLRLSWSFVVARPLKSLVITYTIRIRCSFRVFGDLQSFISNQLNAG